MSIVSNWSYIKLKKMLEIDILRNSSQNLLGILKVFFEGLGVQITVTHPAG